MQTNPAKAVWSERISRSLATSNFSEAMIFVHHALEEFPDDGDLLKLEEQIVHSRDRSVQVYQLMAEGRQFCAEEKFEEGVEILREAYYLDERNMAARSALVDNLLCYAAALLETDLPLAERLAGEAAGLDPANLISQSVARSIQEQKQQPGRSKPLRSDEPRPAAAPSVEAPATAKAQGARILQTPDKAAGPIPAYTQPASGKPAFPQKPSADEAAVPAQTKQTAPAAGAPPEKQKSQPRFAVRELSVMSTVVVPVKPETVPPNRPPISRPPVSRPPVSRPPHEVSEMSSIAAPSQQETALPDSPPATSREARASAPLPLPPRPQPAVNLGAASWRALLPQALAARLCSGQGNRPGGPQGGKQHALAFLTWGLAGVALLVLLLDAGFILRAGRRRGAFAPPVIVHIQTSPAGAAVRVNGQLRDVDQDLSLSPGPYRIEAELDGYDTAVRDVVITAGSGGAIQMTLFPTSQALRISTDLDSGFVFLDGQPAGQLENGQFALASLAGGSHTLRVTSGKQIEVIVPFDVEPNAPPLVSGPISEKELHTILISSYHDQARVSTGSDPSSVELDGQAIGKVGRGADLELSGLSAGSHQFTFGAEDQRQLALAFGAGPALYVSLSSDRQAGTVEIAANESGFGVLINGKPARVTPQRGRYYVYNVAAAPASVQIFKPGFTSDPAERTAVVRKGATLRLAFRLTPVPTAATLHLLGALPGTQVSIDGVARELVNGALTENLPAGDHIIALTRTGYKPKSLKISAQAGQSIALKAPDVAVDSPSTGKLLITERSPASTRIVLQRNGSEFAIDGREVEVPEGDYLLKANAPGFRDFSHAVHVSSTLAASAAVVLTALPQIVRMEGWDHPEGWELKNEWYQRRGGSFVLFKPSAPEGSYEFTAKSKGRDLPFFRGGRIRWVLNYTDPQNYDLYELDGEKLSWKQIRDGKTDLQRQARHGVKIEDGTYKLILQIGAGQLTAKLYDGLNWIELPKLESGPLNSSGRFGFYLPGDDEVWLSDFAFKPKG